MSMATTTISIQPTSGITISIAVPVLSLLAFKELTLVLFIISVPVIDGDDWVITDGGSLFVEYFFIVGKWMCGSMDEFCFVVGG